VVQVKRKKSETFEAMFRRFTRHMVKSSTLFDAKSNRFRKKKPNDNKERESKLVRIKTAEKYDYLRRIGRIDERSQRRRGRRR
jgi:hypothetical protein